jgi:hypothetical protein
VNNIATSTYDAPLKEYIKCFHPEETWCPCDYENPHKIQYKIRLDTPRKIIQTFSKPGRGVRGIQTPDFEAFFIHRDQAMIAKFYHPGGFYFVRSTAVPVVNFPGYSNASLLKEGVGEKELLVKEMLEEGASSTGFQLQMIPHAQFLGRDEKKGEDYYLLKNDLINHSKVYEEEGEEVWDFAQRQRARQTVREINGYFRSDEEAQMELSFYSPFKPFGGQDLYSK